MGEQERLPPPPPLLEKKPAELQAYNRAGAFEAITNHFQTTKLGCVADSGGTPIMDPDAHIGLSWPTDRLGVVKELAALEQEVGKVSRQVREELVAQKRRDNPNKLMFS